MDTTLNTEQLHDLTNDFTKLIENTDTTNLTDTFATLLAIPDEKFEVLAPGILESYRQSINNPNDRLVLCQVFNANGIKSDDMQTALEEITTALDKINDFSVAKKDFMKNILMTMANAVSETEGISKRIMNVPISLCHPNAIVPQYAHPSDSGADVFAIEDVTIAPGETKLVRTGLKAAIPPGYELQVRPKSGRSLKTKLRIANAPGTIDQEYRDEIKIIIENVEPPIHNVLVEKKDGVVTDVQCEYGATYYINKGEKFCQLILAESPKAAFYRVDNVADLGGDRHGGFGSTGLHLVKDVANENKSGTN